MNPSSPGKTKKPLIFTIIFIVGVVVAVSLASSFATSKQTPLKSENTVRSTGPAVVSPSLQSEQTAAYVMDENTEKAELKIDGMSCSGCIYTIKSSLNGIGGIKDILVDVAAGKAEIVYDKTKLDSLERVETAITQSGYPAKTIRVWTADQVREESDRIKQKAKHYVATVGDYDITRGDFLTELEHAKKRYAQIYGPEVFSDQRGADLLSNLKVQIVSRLINQGIQLQEIQKAGYMLSSTAAADEFDNFLKEKGLSLDQFEKELNQYGYSLDYFKKKYESRVLVKKYLDEKILLGTTTEFEKQQRYASWFNNARLLARVVYYDKDLKRLVQAQASGGGCSGGSCSRASN